MANTKIFLHKLYVLVTNEDEKGPRYKRGREGVLVTNEDEEGAVASSLQTRTRG